MKAALLDISILTALLWPTHEHHDAAHRWFGGRADARWATCPLTQLGFVGIVSNPAFSRDALSPLEALALLGENLAHPGHEFWPEGLQVPPAVKGIASSLIERGLEPALGQPNLSSTTVPRRNSSRQDWRFSPALPVTVVDRDDRRRAERNESPGRDARESGRAH